MSKNKIGEYKIWIDRANDDLRWTQSNLKEEIYYGACFTAQQAAEKALKAFLLYKQGRFDKIHDLVKLIEDCTKYDHNFARFKKKIVKLSYYYIQTRYPDISELDKFTKKDAHEAFEIAKKLVDFVSTKII